MEVSKLVDPSMGFTFYFPLLLALDRKRGEIIGLCGKIRDTSFFKIPAN
jgi:hypothetical protein